MSLSFSSCKLVFTSLIFTKILLFCSSCHMINSEIKKIIHLLCFGHLSRLDGWILVLWSRRFTPVVFFFISWFYKECPGYFQESHIFIKGIFIFRHYYYYTLFQSLEVALFSCWAAIRVPAILVEAVTLHNQLSRCVSVCQVSVPSSSSQQSTILKCHLFIFFCPFWQQFWGFTVLMTIFFLFKSK